MRTAEKKKKLAKNNYTYLEKANGFSPDDMPLLLLLLYNEKLCSRSLHGNQNGSVQYNFLLCVVPSVGKSRRHLGIQPSACFVLCLMERRL